MSEPTQSATRENGKSGAPENDRYGDASADQPMSRRCFFRVIRNIGLAGTLWLLLFGVPNDSQNRQ